MYKLQSTTDYSSLRFTCDEQAARSGAEKVADLQKLPVKFISERVLLGMQLLHEFKSQIRGGTMSERFLVKQLQ